MGQTISKQKIPKVSNSPSPGPSNQFRTAPAPNLDDGVVASSEPPKRSRRSTIRRSIIGLVGKSKGPSEPTHDSTARSDADPSRKGWKRISRAMSLGATEDARKTLPPVANNRRKGKERAVEVIEGEGDEPSTSSHRPVSPVPISSTSILNNAAVTEDVLAEPYDADGSSPPLEPSNPPPATAPASARADPPQLPPPPSLQPHLDQSQPGARHFPPPGTLVVVQGGVNTIDAGSAPNNSVNNSNTTAQTNNTTSPAIPSRPNSGLFPGSARSRPSTPTGEHPGARNSRTLSSIIRRPTSMFNDSRRNTIIEGDGADADSTNGMPVDVSSDLTTPNTTSDLDPENQAIQQRPLSPGSIDVLGTLLRYIDTSIGTHLLNNSLINCGCTVSPLLQQQLHSFPQIHLRDAQNHCPIRQPPVLPLQLRRLVLGLMGLDRWTHLRSWAFPWIVTKAL